MRRQVISFHSYIFLNSSPPFPSIAIHFLPARGRTLHIIPLVYSTNRKRISVYPTPFIIPDVGFTDTSFFTVGISDTENLSLAEEKLIGFVSTKKDSCSPIMQQKRDAFYDTSFFTSIFIA